MRPSVGSFPYDLNLLQFERGPPRVAWGGFVEKFRHRRLNFGDLPRGRCFDIVPARQGQLKGERVDQRELVNKIAQIEEQARAMLAEFPNAHLSQERLRMIVALTRYINTGLSFARTGGLMTDSLSRPSDNDGEVVRSA